MSFQPILALLVVQLLFGALPVASKFVLIHAHPLFVVVLRSLFATLFFFVLHKIYSETNSDSLASTEPSTGVVEPAYSSALPLNVHLRLVVLAFFGITFNQMALFIALPKTSAAVTSIISPSIALFTLLFSVFLGREKFQKLSFIAILMGAFGVLFVVNPLNHAAHTQQHSTESWADILNVLSAASYAFYLALVGRLPTQLGGLRFSLLFFIYGLVMNLTVFFLYSQAGRMGLIAIPPSFTVTTQLSQLPSSFWAGLLFLLLGATALTYFLNMWALQRVKPSLVGGFVCLQTVFGLFLSQKVLHETLTQTMLIGSFMILSGVVLLAVAHFRTARRDAEIRAHLTKPVMT